MCAVFLKNLSLVDVSFYSKKSAIGQNLLGEAGSCVKSVPFVGNFLYIKLTFTSIFKLKGIHSLSTCSDYECWPFPKYECFWFLY